MEKAKNKKLIPLVTTGVVVVGTMILGGCSFGGTTPVSENQVSEIDGDVSTVESNETTDDTETVKQTDTTSTTVETTTTTVSVEEKRNKEIEEKLASMTTEEKVAQMFVVMPEAISDASPVTEGYELKEGLYEYPLGGILLMGQNIINKSQTKELIKDVQMYSEDRIGIPLLMCVDEEGGPVKRVSGTIEGVPELKSAEEMFADGDDIYTVGKTVGGYLSELGFNVDFAPVADVVSASSAGVINGRSFSDQPKEVAKAVKDFANGLESENVYATFKHFPGHGPTRSDTHNGSAYVDKSMDELESWDLVPFQEAIDGGAKFIMISHHTVNVIDPDGTPATLSKTVITDLLKKKMGYEGIVVSDALNMGAISDYYGSDEAALMAVDAGADILLEPSDFYTAYDAVVNAVENGKIKEERIDESVRKILEVKAEL